MLTTERARLELGKKHPKLRMEIEEFLSFERLDDLTLPALFKSFSDYMLK